MRRDEVSNIRPVGQWSNQTDSTTKVIIDEPLVKTETLDSALSEIVSATGIGGEIDFSGGDGTDGGGGTGADGSGDGDQGSNRALGFVDSGGRVGVIELDSSTTAEDDDDSPDSGKIHIDRDAIFTEQVKQTEILKFGMYMVDPRREIFVNATATTASRKTVNRDETDVHYQYGSNSNPDSTVGITTRAFNSSDNHWLVETEGDYNFFQGGSEYSGEFKSKNEGQMYVEKTVNKQADLNGENEIITSESGAAHTDGIDGYRRPPRLQRTTTTAPILAKYILTGTPSSPNR